MHQLKQKLRKWTTGILDLPKDVIFDLPRITQIGNMQIYIENHRGVSHFTSNRLDLNLSAGRLEITGKQLVIRAILPEEVFVEGVIEDVRYRQGKGMK